MSRTERITFGFALVGGTLFFIPSILALLSAVMIVLGRAQAPAGQAWSSLGSGVVLLLLSLPPLGSFFLRRTPRGRTLLRITGWIFLVPALVLPPALAMPPVTGVLLFAISLAGVWMLVWGRPESQ